MLARLLCALLIASLFLLEAHRPFSLLLSSCLRPTDPYGFGECLRDLWDFAARTLTVGGRLVLFIPATPETYREEEIPTHPMLRLIYNS